MCTFSVLHLPGKTVVSMNRDELRQRHERGDLEVSSSFCYPIDPSSGGTWLGLHADGWVAGLLNRYQDSNAGGGQMSRGSLIPRLLDAGDERKGVWDSLDLAQYRPFDCVVVSGVRIEQISWDGTQLKRKQEDAPWMLTSSSERLAEVSTFRRQAWNRVIANGKLSSTDILTRFHAITDSDRPRDSVRVDRPRTHTKSVCQVELAPDSASINYWPESALKLDARLDASTAAQHTFRHTLDRRQKKPLSPE